MEVDSSKEPAQGEIMLFTTSGAFLVVGSVQEIAGRLAAEEWPSFELAESGDHVRIRSEHVVALREGKRQHKGSIGFVHNSKS